MRSTDSPGRWFRQRFGTPPRPFLDPQRDDLVVVASCFDDAEACSTTLERALVEGQGWVPDADAVLRHHLRLPSESVADAVSIAAQDGYSCAGEPAETGGSVALVLRRVQILDALHCAQERSRMAGMAQRLGGWVEGWDAEQPARTGDSRTD